MDRLHLRGPLHDRKSFDRWSSAVVLVGSGVAAVVLNQVSGLLGFYVLDCAGGAQLGLFGAAFWLLAAGPAVAVVICSSLATWSAVRGYKSWPFAVAAAELTLVIVVVSDPVAQGASSGC